jgi:CRISPR-associated protein Cas2
MRYPVQERFDVLVCYDVKTTSIGGEKRLRDVGSACKRYGQRVQYSVFECSLTPMLLEKLRAKLLDIIDPEEDNLRIYHLHGPRGKQVETHGVSGYVDFQGPLTL